MPPPSDQKNGAKDELRAGGDPSELRQLQQRFWRFITAPTGVADAVDTIAVDDPGAKPLTGWLGLSDDATATERLDVYANMYFYRLRDILAEDFEQVHHLVGAERFHNLITDYLLENAPNDPNIRNIGDRLPGFIASHGLSDNRPYLADLARFEWARLSVFDAADDIVLEKHHLAGLPADAWPTLALKRIAASTIEDYAWPAPTLHAQARADETIDLEPEATSVIVWRRDVRVHNRVITDPERAALRTLDRGATFAEVCEAFVGAEDEATAALTALVRWIDEGLLAVPKNLETAQGPQPTGVDGSANDRAGTKETGP